MVDKCEMSFEMSRSILQLVALYYSTSFGYWDLFFSHILVLVGPRMLRTITTDYLTDYLAAQNAQAVRRDFQGFRQNLKKTTRRSGFYCIQLVVNWL